MFLCVSPNPAIDKRLAIPAFTPGEIHRARSTRSFAGGKATHVAMVLRTLGEAPHWIGPVGGATGEELVSGLRALGIEPHTVLVKGSTRTNLELVDDSGKVTEILEPGPKLSTEETESFERACGELFETFGKSATVLFSGSLPASAPVDLYKRLVANAQRAGCKTYLDTGGIPLLLALEAKPDFVKPNAKEVSAALGIPVDSLPGTYNALKKLRSAGARTAAVSMGLQGLVYQGAQNEGILVASTVEVDAKSTVGCGDSAFAGFAKGIADGLSAQETLRLAVACAAANCIAESPGAARLQDIQRFQNQVKVQMAEGEAKVR